MQVEKIDDAFNLKPLPAAALGKQTVISSPENPLRVVSLIPRYFFMPKVFKPQLSLDFVWSKKRRRVVP